MTVAHASAAHGRPLLDAQVLAIQNADVLAALAGDTKGPADIAAATGRDPSNLRRTLERLRREGLVHGDPGGPVILTEAGNRLRLRIATLDDDPPPQILAATADPDAVAVTVDQLTPDASNPRRRSGFSPAEILDMAVSLRAEYAATGKPFITPPTVYPQPPGIATWRIAKGERRWRGWREAVSLGWLPDDLAVVCPIYRGDDAQGLASAIVENLQRRDLDSLEEAEAFAELRERLGVDADPDAGLNPVAQICRLIGKSGESGERYVQERLRVADKASDANKARFIESRRRAAEGDPDAEPFLWKHLRDSVKVPRHITALEKSPALRLLVLEMAALADNPWDELVPVAYSPGALLDLGFAAGLVTQYQASRAACLTQTACDWLDSQDWRNRPDAILREARHALIGEAAVAALAPGEQVSAELNVTPIATPLPEGEVAGRSPVGEGSAAASEPGSDTDADTEIPTYLRRLAGGPAANTYNGQTYPNPTMAAEARRRAEHQGGASSPASPPKPLATERQPTDRERLIIVEVAWRADIARGGDGFADAFGIHGDPVAMAMIPHWLLTRMGDGCTRVALTRYAQAWLAGYYEGGMTPKDLDAARYAAGKIDFNTVEQLRASGRFATPWLNTPTQADAPSSPGDSAAAARPEDLPSEASAKEGLDGEAEERPASPSPNLDPVALMRRALIGLWREARDSRYALGVAARAPVNADGRHEIDAGDYALLVECAASLAEAIRHADLFIPTDLKAALDAEAAAASAQPETSDHD